MTAIITGYVGAPFTRYLEQLASLGADSLGVAGICGGSGQGSVPLLRALAG